MLRGTASVEFQLNLDSKLAGIGDPKVLRRRPYGRTKALVNFDLLTESFACNVDRFPYIDKRTFAIIIIIIIIKDIYIAQNCRGPLMRCPADK